MYDVFGTIGENDDCDSAEMYNRAELKNIIQLNLFKKRTLVNAMC